jgi:hypothetical protein
MAFPFEVSRNMTDWWLSSLTSNQQQLVSNTTDLRKDASAFNNNAQLAIYALLFLSNTLFSFVRAFVSVYGFLKAGKRMHNKLLENLFKVSI